MNDAALLNEDEYTNKRSSDTLRCRSQLKSDDNSCRPCSDHIRASKLGAEACGKTYGEKWKPGGERELAEMYRRLGKR